jgi:RNA recognition motif-containing protein
MANKSLYVGNLPYTVGEKELWDYFSEFDPQAVRVVEGRGFGFVDVPAEQAAAAIESRNGAEMGGRKLVVNEAQPRGGGGGGGGGSYGNRDRDRRGGGGGGRW